MKTREVATMLLAIFWLFTGVVTIVSSEIERLESEVAESQTIQRGE